MAKKSSLKEDIVLQNRSADGRGRGHVRFIQESEERLNKAERVALKPPSRGDLRYCSEIPKGMTLLDKYSNLLDFEQNMGEGYMNE